MVTNGLLSFLFAVVASEVEQVPDGEQAAAGAAGEERDAGESGRGRKRGKLVLHLPVLQAQVQRGQRRSGGQGMECKL